jgi:hypothetical protein
VVVVYWEASIVFTLFWPHPPRYESLRELVGVEYIQKGESSRELEICLRGGVGVFVPQAPRCNPDKMPSLAFDIQRLPRYKVLGRTSGDTYLFGDEVHPYA